MGLKQGGKQENCFYSKNNTL